MITRDWLRRQAAAPYLLDRPNTTYRLLVDVQTEGPAFVIAAPNLTFDLNGHKIVYGTSKSIHVPNGGFEEGREPTDVPGWDVKEAPGALRKPARTGMWGQWMLHVPDISSTRRVLSDKVLLPTTKRAFAATVATRGKNIKVVRLKVLDAASDKVLAQSVASSAAYGYGPVVTFTPSSQAVKLLIEADPVPKTTGEVDLDYAAVLPAQDSGIIATRASWSLPKHLQTPAITAGCAKVEKFTLKNGTILQGQGHSYAGSSLCFKTLRGVTVEGVTTVVNGIDAVNVDGTYASGVTIRGCTFRANIDRIVNRQAIYAAIRLFSTTGPLVVDGNQIFDYPQQGIAVAERKPGSGKVTIVNNVIKQRAIVTNGYGISLNAVQDFVIAHNKIMPVKGRGVLLDGYGESLTEKGEIFDNEVDVYEEPNLEYAAAGLEATALRLRTFAAGVHRRLHIHDNTFVARTGPMGARAAIGLRITQFNKKGRNDNANNVIENNLFKAVVTTADPAFHAWAVSTSGVDAGTGLQISRNVLESNDVSLQFGDNDSYGGKNEDIQMAGNILRRSRDGEARKYTPVVVGAWNNSVSRVRLVGTKLENGATAELQFDGPGAKDLGVGSLLDVVVKTSEGKPVAAARIEVLDRQRGVVFSGKTDDSGKLPAIPVVTLVYRQQGKDSKSRTTDRRGPFTITAKSGSLATSRTLAPDANGSVTLILEPQGD